MLDWPEIVASLTRRYPFYSGVSRLANGRLLATVAPPSSKKRWIAAPGGYVRSSLDDFIGRTVFFGGDLDRKLSWLLRRFILPGDCVLDIGANIGIVSLLMSKLVGPSGIVHAFEPNPIVFETLAEAIVFNRRSNIQIHRVALGNQDTTMELHVPVGNSGAGSLLQDAKSTARQTHEVAVRRLDRISFNRRVAFVKIDVEGMECEVFSGAERMLRNNKPAVLFEANEIGGNTRAERSVNFLRSLGYELLSIPKCLVRMRTDPLIESSGGYTHDLIALPAKSL